MLPRALGTERRLPPRQGSRVSWILTSSGEAQMSQMQSLALAYDRSDPKHPYAWPENAGRLRRG
jgi:hypothetical protein